MDAEGLSGTDDRPGPAALCLGPCEPSLARIRDHLTVIIYDLVVEPLAGLEPDEVVVADLGADATRDVIRLGKKGVDFGALLLRERCWELRNARRQLDEKLISKNEEKDTPSPPPFWRASSRRADPVPHPQHEVCLDSANTVLAAVG